MRPMTLLAAAGLVWAAAPGAPAQSEPAPQNAPEQTEESDLDPLTRQLLEELRRMRERLDELEEQREEDKARIEALERMLRERGARPADSAPEEAAPTPSRPAAQPSRPARQPSSPAADPAARRPSSPAAPQPSSPFRPAPPPPGGMDSLLGFGQGNALNPEITIFFDMGGNISDRDDPESDRFNLRETEIDFRAPVAPFADAVAIFAIPEELEEGEDGETSSSFEFEAEEVYINFHTLPYDLSLKGGKFRNAFGRNNLLHTHDLPQVTRPLAVESFLGGEGLSTIGASLSWLVPNPADEYIELTAEVVNADGGEESPILGGAEADNPAALGRLKWFTDLGDWASMELGTSYMFGSTGSDSNFDANLFGLDFTYQRRDPDAPDLRSFLFQSELFWGSNDRFDEFGDGFRNDSFGMYAYAQQQVAQNWYAGLRYDYTEFPNSEDFGAGDESWAFSPYVSYYLTEWIRLRLEYQHRADQINGDWESDGTLWFGLTFNIGAHPPHPYWVNR